MRVSNRGLWFENLYRQTKVNSINGWKDDGCLANYPHYLSLCCSTRSLDLADFIYGSRKDVNMAWGDGQSGKVWNSWVGLRGITQGLYSWFMAWHSKRQKQKVYFLNIVLQPHTDGQCRSCHLGLYKTLPIKIRLISAWQSTTHSFSYSSQLLNQITTAFLLFFQKG